VALGLPVETLGLKYNIKASEELLRSKNFVSDASAA
jgi:hypothetical protein